MPFGNFEAIYFISVPVLVNSSKSTIFLLMSGWESTESERSTLMERRWVGEGGDGLRVVQVVLDLAFKAAFLLRRGLE